MESEDEDTSLDNIIKSRLHQIVNRINGHITEAEAYCKGGSDDEESVQKAQICAFKLENMIKRFTTELNEYFRTSNNPSPDEISDMSNAQLNGEEILAELKCRLSVIVDKNKKEIQSNKEHSRAFSAKLPTLTLPEFQGDVLTWCEFWDIYKSNIHDRPIPDVDKLLYLKSTLKGEPRRIIDGLETTNKNYAVAINILTDRYGKQTRIIDAHYSALGKINTGLMWNIKRDTLRLNIKSESFKEENVREPQSKRKILSTIASMYDPCGLGSPLILPTKLLLQQLWETKIKWDTILPDELQRKWEDIIHRLEAIKEIEIPRYMGLTGEAVYELHGFSDASKQAYAAVIYLTVENEDQGNVSFVMAKSKVVPKEEREDLRMPRLELLGCYLGSKLMKYIKSVIGITIKKEYLWTDSKIVLSWVHSNKLLPPFIARRVNAIKENKQLELRYVNTELNPADLATRPDLWEKKKTLWLNGPEFLQQGKEKWPSHSVFKIQELSPGQGPSDTINLMEIDEKIPDKTFREENIPVDTVKIMKDLQKEYFPLESEGKKTSLATNLELFKDIDGLLRCNGRLKHADWSFDKRHPILIPRDCEFTNDLVMKIHRENYHMKANHTLSRVRESYWIPKGKSYIQRLLAKCPECVKQSGGPFKLPPAPTLPFERVNYSSPFTYTGVDYMGPLLINNGDGNSKRWICLFTCLVVRAIHLEVVQDLTAEEGLLALRRMISARGIPSLVTSDNAQHFKLIGEITSSQYCIDKKIRWRYIIPLSPWAGGFYERLIGIVKNCMKRTLGKHMLRDNQLTTIVKEIEAVVNSRPLTSVDSEPDHILKPSDFLTVGKVITVEESENESEPRIISTTKTDLIKGWKRALILLKEFKDMFSNRYLLSLRERYGHLPREPRITSKLKPSPGQIVQIKGDSKNRNDWKVGKITELIPSADGLCRAAKVQVGNSEYTRSIAHLYPLEIEDAPDPVTNICDIGETRPLVTPDIDTVNTEELEKIHPQVHESTTDEITQPQAIAPMSLMEDDHVSIQAEGEDNALTEKKDESLPNRTETNNIEVNQRLRRAAATKAIQKIKEWTRDLTALLLHSGALPPGSVASGANL